MGQFLYMKYKVGIKKNKGAIRSLNSRASILDLLPSATNPIQAINNIVRTITPARALGYEALRDLPLLLKNPFSLLKVIFCALLTMNGTTNIVIQSDEQATLMSSQDSLKTFPTLIPSQNIRFQKLSLFRRDLIKFMIAFIFKLMIIINSQIVAQFKILLKRITIILLILSSLFSSLQCVANDLLPLISKTEQEYNIPTGLLLAIANIESTTKPYALNIGGRAIFAKSKAEAVAIVRYHLDQGRDNIDLGVMQINLYWHGKNFADIEQMLTPKNNIEYAAKFLTKLYEQHGSWNLAIRYYHSAKSEHNNKYAHKILLSWLGN